MDRSKLTITGPAGGIYPPAEVEIDGKVYHAKPVTRPLWRELRKLELRIKDGDLSAYYEQIEALTDAPAEVVDLLDYRDVKKVVDFLMDSAMKPEEGEQEKKTLEPGPAIAAGSPGPSPVSSPSTPSKP